MSVDEARLDAVLADTIGRGRVPGISAAVVTTTGSKWAGSAGIADVTTNLAVAPDTPFLWFSMTKIVTATAALQLVDAGSLAFDDEVEAWVPGVLPRSDGKPVLVRHLLQHSAGIPNPPPIRWVRPASNPAPDAGAFLRERFARVKKLRFEPGTRAAYTNLGFLLLGEVISAAAGRPFTDYAQDEVLTPLGLHTTSFTMPAAGATTATGHQRLLTGLGPVVDAMLPRGIVGSRAGRWLTFRPFLVNGASYGGLVGPVTDAARVVLAHANGGIVDGTRILSESVAVEMQTISMQGKPFDLGLGWFRRPKDRDHHPSFVEHYGGGGGYHNLMRLYPEPGVGVVVMGNSTSFDVDATVDALAAPFVG